MLVDSHCHLPLLADAAGGISPEMAIAGAREAGVERLLCVSVDLEGFPRIAQLAREHPEVRCSVGVHPNARDVEEPTVDRLAALAAAPEVVAVGETGLDYFRSPDGPATQRERFARHVQAARACGKPLVIHSREARGEVVELLRDEGAQAVGGVMHCFVDDWDVARAALDLGFYISFSGIVTFRNARSVQEVARRVPLDRLLVETDAPYLAPVPHRGKVNRPGWVRHVAEFLADLRDVPFERLAEATTENFYRLFPTARGGTA